MARSQEDKQMERIAALLSQAEDENNTQEARESAAKMAEALGAKYSIDFAVASLHTQHKHERDDEIVTREIIMPYKSGSTRDQGWVALMLELAYACNIYIVWRDNIITSYGPKFDVEFANALFYVLVNDQEDKALEFARTANKKNKSSSLTLLKNSFRQGYRERVRTRIENLRDERMSEIDEEQNLSAGSTALAVRNRTDEMFSQFEEAVKRKNVQKTDNKRFHVNNADRNAVKEGDYAGSVVKLFADTPLPEPKKGIN